MKPDPGPQRSFMDRWTNVNRHIIEGPAVCCQNSSSFLSFSDLWPPKSAQVLENQLQPNDSRNRRQNSKEQKILHHFFQSENTDPSQAYESISTEDSNIECCNSERTLMVTLKIDPARWSLSRNCRRSRTRSETNKAISTSIFKIDRFLELNQDTFSTDDDVYEGRDFVSSAVLPEKTVITDLCDSREDQYENRCKNKFQQGGSIDIQAPYIEDCSSLLVQSVEEMLLAGGSKAFNSLYSWLLSRKLESKVLSQTFAEDPYEEVVSPKFDFRFSFSSQPDMQMLEIYQGRPMSRSITLPVYESSRHQNRRQPLIANGETDKNEQDNYIIIHGPTSSGKTLSIQIAAKLLGYKIVELTNCHKRSGKEILDSLKVSSQSHMLSTKEEMNMCESQSLILLEDVDIVFTCDIGFWSAINTLIKISRRPIVMTCTNIEIVRKSFDAAHSVSQIPFSWTKSFELLVRTCTARHLMIDDWRLFSIQKIMKNDIRKIFSDIKFWLDPDVNDDPDRYKNISLRNFIPQLKDEDILLKLQQQGITLDWIFFPRNKLRYSFVGTNGLTNDTKDDKQSCKQNVSLSDEKSSDTGTSICNKVLGTAFLDYLVRENSFLSCMDANYNSAMAISAVEGRSTTPSVRVESEYGIVGTSIIAEIEEDYIDHWPLTARLMGSLFEMKRIIDQTPTNNSIYEAPTGDNKGASDDMIVNITEDLQTSDSLFESMIDDFRKNEAAESVKRRSVLQDIWNNLARDLAVSPIFWRGENKISTILIPYLRAIVRAANAILKPFINSNSLKRVSLRSAAAEIGNSIGCMKNLYKVSSLNFDLINSSWDPITTQNKLL